MPNLETPSKLSEVLKFLRRSIYVTYRVGAGIYSVARTLVSPPATKEDGAEVVLYGICARAQWRGTACKQRCRDDKPERVAWQYGHDGATQNSVLMNRL
jgi:hypothetical protein